MPPPRPGLVLVLRSPRLHRCRAVHQVRGEGSRVTPHVDTLIGGDRQGMARATGDRAHLHASHISTLLITCTTHHTTYISTSHHTTRHTSPPHASLIMHPSSHITHHTILPTCIPHHSTPPTHCAHRTSCNHSTPPTHHADHTACNHSTPPTHCAHHTACNHSTPPTHCAHHTFYKHHIFHKHHTFHKHPNVSHHTYLSGRHTSNNTFQRDKCQTQNARQIHTSHITSHHTSRHASHHMMHHIAVTHILARQI